MGRVSLPLKGDRGQKKMQSLGVFVAILSASLATGLLLEEEEERAVVQGSHCDYIILSEVPKLSGCSDGFKFVIRKTRGVRSQYLVLGGKTLLAFLKTGQKFSQCKSFNNITPTIKCKGPIGGLQPDFTPGNWTGGDNSGGVTSGPGVTVPNVPNPGSDGGTFEITIVQSWSQETNYARVTQVQVPPTTAGQKVPMVIDLHGNGGQGNLRRLSYLADGAVIVAPSGYERSWNVNNEKSKADDVSFILELIARVAEDPPAADANNVNLIGTSNGAAIIYRLLIATGVDRPFHRVFPMVSSMISVQWRDGSFWKAPDTMSNDYTIQTVPEFADNFEYYHFHGTNDGTIAYDGKCPGPGFLGAGVCVIAAQETDYLIAQAMGYTGTQIPDSDGVEIASNFVEYSYLDGRVKHYKDMGGTHGSTFGNENTKAVLEEVILGRTQ